MTLKKKILLRSILGAPIGVTVSSIVTIIISLCVGQGNYYPTPYELIDWCRNETIAVIVQMLCSLFIGAICGGASVIWEIDKWSLLKQTAVNFAVMALPFLGLGYILNWMPHHIYGALGYVGGFVSGYIILWCAIYFSIKVKIKKLNKQLQKHNGNNNP